ncbi:MAG: DoxX family protein [Chloroflexia bacterium]
MTETIRRLFGRWAAPIGTRLSAMSPLGWVALLLRLYTAGLVGYLFTTAGLKNMGFLNNAGFVGYGYDKLFNADKIYSINPSLFSGIGVPFPDLTHFLIGCLEFFGGIAVFLGLLTRLWSFLLAGNMLVAMLTVGYPDELPLFISSALLVLLGGGALSLDQMIDRRFAGPPVSTLTTDH